uniref:hypothetical protein n=1 Tax=Dialister sp. TaxID=1955814 RepID=UPI004024ABD4
SNGAASSATGIILPHCLSYVNCFFMFFEMALSGCGVSLWLVWRKGFPGFLIEGFPFFAFLTLSALPHTEKISRSARNDGVGRGFMRLRVIMAGFARRFPDDGFPVFVLRLYTVLPRMKKISRFARNDGVGRSFTRLCVIMAGFARRFLDDGFPVFRSSLIHRFTANEKDFSLRSK